MYRIILGIILSIWIMYISTETKLEKRILSETIFSTGDIILFHSYINPIPFYLGQHFTHIGIVILCEGEPYILEGVNYSDCAKIFDYPSNGLVLSPIKTRLEVYKGLVYHKPLIKPIPIEDDKLNEFLNYLMGTMYYDKDTIYNTFCKIFGWSPPCGAINCAEIVFILLIYLRVIPFREFYKRRFNYLGYLVGYTGGFYGPIYELIYPKFSSIFINRLRKANRRIGKNLNTMKNENYT